MSISHIKTKCPQKVNCSLQPNVNQSTPGTRETGPSHICLSSHKECQINCLRRLAIKETVTGKDEGDRAKPHCLLSWNQYQTVALMNCVCNGRDHSVRTVSSHPAEAPICNSHTAAILYKNEGKKQTSIKII